MKKTISAILCAALLASGCAATTPRFQTAPRVADAAPAPAQRSANEQAVLTEFAKLLPAGTRVRATVTGNRTLRGTLLKVTDTEIVVQPRTRVPEPLVTIPFTDLLALEQDTSNGGNVGRAMVIGAATGAGAALGVFLLIIAILD